MGEIGAKSSEGFRARWIWLLSHLVTNQVEFGDERRGKGDGRERNWSANGSNFGRGRARIRAINTPSATIGVVRVRKILEGVGWDAEVLGDHFGRIRDRIGSGGRAADGQKDAQMALNLFRIDRNIRWAADQTGLARCSPGNAIWLHGGRGLGTSLGSGDKMGEEFSRWTQQHRQLRSLEINKSRG